MPDVIKSLVFIHEIIHAEMLRFLLENQEQIPNTSEDQLRYYTNSGDDSYVFNTFEKINIPEPVMATSYRYVIENSLSRIYPGLTKKELTALSWIGLDGTNAYDKKKKADPKFEEKLKEIHSQILNKYPNECK